MQEPSHFFIVLGKILFSTDPFFLSEIAITLNLLSTWSTAGDYIILVFLTHLHGLSHGKFRPTRMWIENMQLPDQALKT